MWSIHNANTSYKYIQAYMYLFQQRPQMLNSKDYYVISFCFTHTEPWDEPPFPKEEEKESEK